MNRVIACLLLASMTTCWFAIAWRLGKLQRVLAEFLVVGGPVLLAVTAFWAIIGIAEVSGATHPTHAAAILTSCALASVAASLTMFFAGRQLMKNVRRQESASGKPHPSWFRLF